MRELAGRKILIVEDNWLQAMEIAQLFRHQNAEVIGPVGTIEGGLKWAGVADAAVLDVDIGGDPVFPVADVLEARHVPFLFFSGASTFDVPARYLFSDRLSKPANLELLSYDLKLLEAGDGDRSRAVEAFLPILRMTARLLIGEPRAADRLVERTLAEAVKLHADAPESGVGDWLMSLMSQVSGSGRGRLMS